MVRNENNPQGLFCARNIAALKEVTAVYRQLLPCPIT